MNNAGSGFIILTVLVGIFLSGLSFGMGHLYIGFGFVTWVGLAMVALMEIRKDEEAKEND
ncbi:hypothetical protein B6U55_03080 [Ligilactobacillus salivarius]|uniref:hypothetical protein n=1 Tax=Ligilactobacillus salivarius TaxID=1624 RepID=UPI0009DB3630|nr:hypothetical protein [Ligilactobacillus salivarius]MBC6925137.1 hypothetical protein [Ligilactobacillus salivarius]OQQ93732.1 hypothetical protein B6U55_03080 [Ligilactobacillus salivarius]